MERGDAFCGAHTVATYKGPPSKDEYLANTHKHRQLHKHRRQQFEAASGMCILMNLDATDKLNTEALTATITMTAGSSKQAQPHSGIIRVEHRGFLMDFSSKNLELVPLGLLRRMYAIVQGKRGR